MMTATERAEINRRNARKSTGPSPEARMRTRFNAVKHGCRARLPVLPGEDPQAYQDRLEAWIGKFQPGDDAELYLVECAVLSSWRLDRADRAEAAQLEAEIDDEAAHRDRKVARLGAELFRVPGRGIGCPPDPAAGPSDALLSSPFDPAHPRHPARLVSALEATATGCEWLREHWAELGKRLDEGKNWRATDRLRAIRMLGQQPLDVVADEQLLTIYLACHATDPHGPDVFAEPLSDLYRAEDEATRIRLADKFAAARAARAPRDAAEGRAALRAIVASAVGRIESLREARAAAESDAAADISARLSHNAKVSVEWLRKHQDTCSRALYRSFDELRKLRRDFGDALTADEEPAEPTAPGPCAEVARAPGPCEMAPVPEAGARGSREIPHGQDARATWEADVARASSPCEMAPAPEVYATSVADVAPASGPYDVVDLPPSVTEPMTIEPVDGHDARHVTNEANGPSSMNRALLSADEAGTVTNEANTPFESSPVTQDNGQGTPDRTNEASAKAERTGRLVPVVRAIAVFLLILLSAGLAGAFGASVDIIGSNPSTPREEWPVARDAARSASPGPVPLPDAHSPGGWSGDRRDRIAIGRATSSTAHG